MLAAEIIAPLVVPNSSFDETLTDQARDRAAELVAPVPVAIAQGQVVVRNGEPLTAADLEVIEALGLGVDAPLDLATFAGWFLLAVLTVAMLLAWIWRFRPTLWHRDNVLLLVGLLLVGTALALKVTAGREVLGYFLPTAAIGDAPRDPARRLDRHDRAGHHRDHGRRAGGHVARVRELHLPRRAGGRRRGPQGRPTAGLRPGGDRGLHRQCPGRVGLLVAGHHGCPRRARAVVRLGGVRGRLIGRRGRYLRGPRLGVRDPDGLPAPRAGEPVPTAAAPAPGRDARARITTR